MSASSIYEEIATGARVPATRRDAVAVSEGSEDQASGANTLQGQVFTAPPPWNPIAPGKRISAGARFGRAVVIGTRKKLPTDGAYPDARFVMRCDCSNYYFRRTEKLGRTEPLGGEACPVCRQSSVMLEARQTPKTKKEGAKRLDQLAAASKPKSHRQGWGGTQDPLESTVAAFLDRIGEPYDRDHPARLDFHLPRLDLFIECKRFATPRIAEQLARVRDQDVIVIQGAGALEKLRAVFALERTP